MDYSMSPILTDGATNDDFNTAAEGEYSAADAFAASWKDPDAAEPSEDEKEVKPQDKPVTKNAEVEPDLEEEVQGEGEGEEGDEENEPGEKQYVEGDEVFVKVKVGDNDHEVSVNALKRLYGQESALTQKSQEVAAKRKQIDEQATAQAAALDRLLTKARARFEPYTKINFLLAAKELDAESLTALQAEAQAAHEDVQFLEQEMGTLSEAVQKQQQETFATAAKECIKVLSDPETGIEGWGEPLYKELITYANSVGIPESHTHTLADPAAFRIIHKAMLYDKGAKKVKEDKADPANKKTPPKKIVKSSTNTTTTKKVTGGGNKADAAMERLAKTGTLDDAANAFTARWSGEE